MPAAIVSAAIDPLVVAERENRTSSFFDNLLKFDIFEPPGWLPGGSGESDARLPGRSIAAAAAP